MSAVEKDFDNLARLDSDGWTQNNHYHDFLLRHVPWDCRNALEIGCGTGAFSRRLAKLAQHVVALDLSPEMIQVAQFRSKLLRNTEFQRADVMNYLPAVSVQELRTQSERFDCIVSIATLHHLELREILARMKGALRPRGVLIVLDLFEANRDLTKPEGMLDAISNLIAIGVSGSLRLIHNGRLKPPPEVRAAWAAHERHDSYPTMRDIRALCAEILPAAKVRKHLLWRYSIVWEKPLLDRVEGRWNLAE